MIPKTEVVAGHGELIIGMLSAVPSINIKDNEITRQVDLMWE